MFAQTQEQIDAVIEKARVLINEELDFVIAEAKKHNRPIKSDPSQFAGDLLFVASSSYDVKFVGDKLKDPNISPEERIKYLNVAMGMVTDFLNKKKAVKV